jgi:hypothetical protein
MVMFTCGIGGMLGGCGERTPDEVREGSGKQTGFKATSDQKIGRI